jgi:hypothetical protein
MGLTLRRTLDCFSTLRARLLFMTGALLFPYFVFGFLGLNKEIYAMCAAMLFATYMVRGRTLDLLFALAVAACARYYMVLALLLLLLLVPRAGRPRYALMIVTLLAISIAAPAVKLLVPGYSAEDLLEDSGVAGRIFAAAIDSFGYALIYPIKYLVLIPLRAYGFLLGAGRPGDAMDAVVSIASLVVLVLALQVMLQWRRASAVVRRLVVAALVAPMPIMWSEIMHWRYYSFVYFFFLVAVVLHGVERRRTAPVAGADRGDA